MLDLERKFTHVSKIYEDITGASEEKKLEAITNLQPQMERIKREVTEQDKHMQRQAKNLKTALVKTVNTEGLKSKITEKFMGFLRVNANKLY